MYILLLALAATAHAQDGGLRDLLKNFSSSRPASTLVPFTTAPSASDDSCDLGQGRVGHCVPYYLCSEEKTVNDDGDGLIDIRGLPVPCKGINICCTVDPSASTPQPITTTTSTAAPSDEVKCGVRNTGGLGVRIIGDDLDSEADFGEFPWLVAIYRMEPKDPNKPDGEKERKYVGGGSLIHPKVVLTAAHVVHTSKPLQIRAGVFNLEAMQELFSSQDRDVEEVIRHKDFNKGTLFYDIALLVLKTPVTVGDNVGLACLPPPRTAAGGRCVTAGWGGKSVLKRVELPVVEHATCQDKLRKTRLGGKFILHNTFMCAGGQGGQDACQGDGGSPLMCPLESDKDRYTVSGLVAWGIGCGDAGSPGVYADVAILRAWVDDKMAGKGLDYKVYSDY